MTIVFRQAEQSDAGELAQLIDISWGNPTGFSGLDLMFEGTVEEKLEQIRRLVLSETKSWFHFSHHMVAVVDGMVASGLCGCCEGDSGGPVVEKALGEVGITPDESNPLGLALYHYLIDPPLSKDSWAIRHVATFPGFRRMGLVDELLEITLLAAVDRIPSYRCPVSPSSSMSATPPLRPTRC